MSLRQVVRALSRRPFLSVLAVALLSFLGSATVGLLIGVPQPRMHDEFSYLLAADTFARGRLTNPTHPHWEHFESVHIIQQPSYASKYPPAQGISLAVGQVLFGHPAVGVWLGSALMCGAVTWMLLAWVPSRWALLGGLLVVVQLGVVGRWPQSYWGGAVAATGGALLYGAVRRIIASRRPSVGLSVVMGLALLVLANSRPFEGMIVSLPAAALLLARMVRGDRPALPDLLRRVVLPTLVVLGVGVAAMLMYNRAVTGEATQMPYMVHEEEYSAVPMFLWQPVPEEPAYRHDHLRRFFTDWPVDRYESQMSPVGFARVLAQNAGAQVWRYAGPVLALVALLGLPCVFRRRWPRFAAGVVLLVFAGVAVNTYYASHYTAPMVGLVFFLLVQSWRSVRAAVRLSPRWRKVATGVVLGLAVLAITPELLSTLKRNGRGPARRTIRAMVEEECGQRGGRHLLLVRYAGYHGEIVYNSADIDDQNIVWAREMDDEHNRALIEHFGDRNVWLLELGDGTLSFKRVRP